MTDDGPEYPEPMTVDQTAISDECSRIRSMLLAKNRAYGSSALAPLRVFSKASPAEQILVRLDDKLSRLRTLGLDGDAVGESALDTLDDLIGYLFLLRIALRRATGR
jgi:hypothetical protein